MATKRRSHVHRDWLRERENVDGARRVIAGPVRDALHDAALQVVVDPESQDTRRSEQQRAAFSGAARGSGSLKPPLPSAPHAEGRPSQEGSSLDCHWLPRNRAGAPRLLSRSIKRHGGAGDLLVEVADVLLPGDRASAT
jgi:hypothetical protein